MVTEPEQSQPNDDTREDAPTKKSSGRRRLVILCTAFLTLTAFAAVTDSFSKLGKMAQKEPRPSFRREPGFPHARSVRVPYNGFDLSNASIPAEEVKSGGPPRDGIPSIDDPKFLPISEVDFLKEGDQVLGYLYNGEAKAYPLRIIVWHEIVNDTVGGRPIAATYCPLCGTCMVFDRRTDEGELTFGVSGLLYNSDVLMFDRETESLWSQLKMESVAGPQVGKKMHWLPSEQMTWAAWKKQYPDSMVLSTETGHGRSYGRQAYADYEKTQKLMFPINKHRKDLKNKEWVLGVLIDGEAKAYPIKKLQELGAVTLEDTLGGSPLTVTYDKEQEWATVKHGETGDAIPSVRAYWFAWQAFYPETELY